MASICCILQLPYCVPSREDVKQTRRSFNKAQSYGRSKPQTNHAPRGPIHWFQGGPYCRHHIPYLRRSGGRRIPYHPHRKYKKEGRASSINKEAIQQVHMGVTTHSELGLLAVYLLYWWLFGCLCPQDLEDVQWLGALFTRGFRALGVFDGLSPCWLLRSFRGH